MWRDKAEGKGDTTTLGGMDLKPVVKRGGYIKTEGETNGTRKIMSASSSLKYQRTCAADYADWWICHVTSAVHGFVADLLQCCSQSQRAI